MVFFMFLFTLENSTFQNYIPCGDNMPYDISFSHNENFELL